MLRSLVARLGNVRLAPAGEMPTSTRYILDFGQLPLEIVEKIFSELEDIQDRLHICLVSRHAHALFIPLLYKNVFLDFPMVHTSNRGHKIKFDFPYTYTTNERLLFVRGVHFRCEIHCNPGFSCTHYPCTNPLPSTTLEALGVLVRIPKGVLRSFSWELGACVPKDVCQYLSLHHTRLSDLSLITGWNCEAERPYMCDFTSKLKSVRSLSWRAPAGVDDARSIYQLIQNNANNLKDLNLDFVNYSDFKSSLPPSNTLYTINLFEHYILQLPDQPEAPIISSLFRLSLTSISFRGLRASTILTFNPANLRSLTLRHCPRSSRFLRLFREATKEPLQLYKFEYIAAPREKTQVILPSLSEFLVRIAWLQHLYLAFGTNFTHQTLWQLLLDRFYYSLRRLVLHAESNGVRQGEWWCNTPWLAYMGDLISLPHLRVFAINPKLPDMHKLLRTLRSRPNIDFLHLRGNHRLTNDTFDRHMDDNHSSDSSSQTSDEADDVEAMYQMSSLHQPFGDSHDDPLATPEESSNVFPPAPILERSDLLNLVSWLFSNPSFTSLQIIASGVFHHGERYDRDLQIFVRKGVLSDFDNDKEPACDYRDRVACHCKSPKHGHRLCDHKRDKPDPEHFAQVKMDSGLWRRLKNEYRDVLEACPIDPLFAHEDPSVASSSRRRHFPGTG